MKTLFAACLGLGLLAAPAAFASGNNPPPGSIDCTESSMTEMNSRIAGIKDDAMRKSAMDDMTNAGMMMKSNKMDDCRMLMERANKSMQSM